MSTGIDAPSDGEIVHADFIHSGTSKSKVSEAYNVSVFLYLTLFSIVHYIALALLSIKGFTSGDLKHSG